MCACFIAEFAHNYLVQIKPEGDRLWQCRDWTTLRAYGTAPTNIITVRFARAYVFPAANNICVSWIIPMSLQKKIEAWNSNAIDKNIMDQSTVTKEEIWACNSNAMDNNTMKHNIVVAEKTSVLGTQMLYIRTPWTTVAAEENRGL